MKNPSYAIRVAVANALSGITYDGVSVKVYDQMAASGATYPRIILENSSASAFGSRLTKCQFGNDWSQTIRVSAYFPGAGRVNSEVVESIADDILQILNPLSGPFLDLSPAFSVWNTNGAVLNTSVFSDSVGQYVDTTIRITYSLTEN